MKEEIANQWINPDTVYASYGFATNHRSRKWLFHKWLNAILEIYGYSENGIHLLKVNSDRAVDKVSRRHWYDHQQTSNPCQCYRCLCGDEHLIESTEQPISGPVSVPVDEYGYTAEAWIIHRSRAV